MNKQKTFWIVIILFFLFSFSYFFYQRYIPETSNITDEQTEKAMKKLESRYNTKELIIVFKDGVSKGEIKKIISEFDGEILDELPEIQNFKLKINKKMTSEEVLYLVEELNEMEEVSMAVLNEKVEMPDESESYFNDSDVENNKVFEKALDIYNKPANVFYSEDGSHTFLYPSKWEINKEGTLSFIQEKKELQYSLKKSKIDQYEDVIYDKIDKEKEKGYTLDGELDQYEHDNLIVVKWIMKKDDVLSSRALIQGDNFYYYFNANEYISFDEFTLIVDSFIRN